jgi:hypothetical protein
MKWNGSQFVEKQTGLLRSFAWQRLFGFGRRFWTWSLLIIAGSAFYFGLQGNAGAQVTILYSFGSGTPTTQGVQPQGGLVQAPDGSFYGTTYAQYGNNGEEFPAGTIYRLDSTTGAVVFVETFPNAGPHRAPASPLLLYNGGLLGVTYGTNKSGGIIFYLNSSGTLDVWHSFDRFFTSVNGNSPFAPLVWVPRAIFME